MSVLSYSPSGTYTWVCPAGVTSVLVECVAAGSGGGFSGLTGGSGGGGGAYAASTLTVVPGNSYTITVGKGGSGGIQSSQTSATAGGDSWFGSTTTVLAKAGTVGASNNGAQGTGGQASACVGTTKVSGSDGGSGVGGGSGGPGGAGATGGSVTGGAGGTPVNNAAGNPGSPPGGGGAGGWAQGTSGFNGGNGADGLVVLTFQGVGSTPGKVVVTYNASNTFTVPPGVTALRLQGEAAGGGGGAGTTLAAGGGGGGGGYAEEPALAVSPGQIFTITIPGTTAASGTGGNVVISRSGTVVLQANGGSPGKAGSGLTTGAGGAGGAGVTGSVKATGTTGTAGGAGGAGGGALGGAGGAASGGAGADPGGGGGDGAVLGGAGGTGGQGQAVITFAYATEVLAAGDQASLVVNFNRAFNDSIAASDTLAKSILRPLSETVLAIDDDNKLVIKKIQPELLTASDALNKAYAQVRNDSVSLSDFTRVILVYLRTFADSVTAADALAKSMQLGKADVAAAMDDVFKLVIKKFPDDTVMVADLFAKFSSYVRTPADSMAANDSYKRAFTVRFNDSISGNGAPVAAPTTRKIFIISD